MTTATATTITQTTRSVLLILEHAERIGLPAPFTHTVANYADPDTAPVTFGFDRLDQVADWAKWMETTVTSEHYGADSVHYCCKGLALDHPLQVFYIEAGSR